MSLCLADTGTDPLEGLRGGATEEPPGAPAPVQVTEPGQSQRELTQLLTQQLHLTTPNMFIVWIISHHLSITVNLILT